MGRGQGDTAAAISMRGSVDLTARPVLALDIDGVLFPLGATVRDPLPIYPGWIQATAAGLPVSYDPEIVPWLHEMAARTEMVWATSWDESANAGAAPLLGLPELPTLDIKGGRWNAVSEYAKGRKLVWCEDRAQSRKIKQEIKERQPAALLVQPKTHLCLTANQRKRISNWLDNQE
jgi:hypothetical protein